MLIKNDSILPAARQFHEVTISKIFQPPKWYASWQKEAVGALLSNLINENIRKLREEHERLSKEMSIQRQNLFLDLRKF
jgi:hypothetical protein